MRQVRGKFWHRVASPCDHDGSFANIRAALLAAIRESQFLASTVFVDDLLILLSVIIELVFQRVELARADSMELVSGEGHIGGKAIRLTTKNAVGLCVVGISAKV